MEHAAKGRDVDEWGELGLAVLRGRWPDARARVAGVVEGWRFARHAVLYLTNAEAEQQMETFEEVLMVLADALDHEPVDEEVARAAVGAVLAVVRSWSGR